MNHFVLAADLGGTNLRLAAVTREGTILSSIRRETPAEGTCAEIADCIAGAAAECLASLDADCAGRLLCLAVPALVDAPSGTIISAPNLPQLNGRDLGALVSERSGLNVFVENDANAAAVGESRLGASRGYRTSICITLGTGVGGGLILDGGLWRGIDGTAGEVGHICVEPGGHLCGCGSTGCLEQYSSASAIVKLAGELMRDFPSTRLEEKAGEITAKQVYEAGKSGDPLSVHVFKMVGQHLGVALAGLVNVLNPEAIVIGGGASAGWDLFIGETEKKINEMAFQRPAGRVRLVRAVLGDSAGILGAAQMAFDALADSGELPA